MLIVWLTGSGYIGSHSKENVNPQIYFISLGKHLKSKLHIFIASPGNLFGNKTVNKYLNVFATISAKQGSLISTGSLRETELWKILCSAIYISGYCACLTE